jgi:diguanylate cyclase (GGDEF)-like protein
MPLLADTATWIAVGFAVAAAVLALTATILLLAVLRRGRAGDEAAQRPPAGRRELRDALEEAREESRRARFLAEIAATIDLDDVLQRTLAVAVEDAAVDAAMLSIHQLDDEPLVATVGMTAEEASRQPVATSPPGGARAVRISYRYGPEDEGILREAGTELIQGGVAVPVREGESAPLGTLAVFWRSQDRGPEEGEVSRLEQLAATCAPAIRNAQRFREARELADVDGLTGLHNRRFFHETLARECARAQRYDRRLALVILDVDDFKETNDRVGHLAGDAVLAAVAERLHGAVRRADLACRVGGDEFAVILPEAGAQDAEQLYRRIQFAVGSGSAGPAERVRVSAGIAELRPEDDPVSLFQRADEALYRAKQGGKGQVRGESA